MKRWIALLILVSPSCAGTPDESTARGAFEAWVRATANGEIERSFAMLSDAFKSEWVFALLEGDDAVVRRWRGALTGTPRTDLDLWWGHCRKNQQPRRDLLPEAVLRHPSLVGLYRDYFTPHAGNMRHEMSRLEIAAIAEDQKGVTVTVRNAGGTTELYGLVPDLGGWKIDSHMATLRRTPQ